MRLPLFLCAFAVAFAFVSRQVLADDDFAKGVDLSILKYAEDHGVQFKINGKVQDALTIFKSNGCNWVRLRLFVNPSGTDGQVNTLDYTLAEAKKVKQAGMKFCLDFHYSDKWADPGHQPIPAQWRDLSHAQLISMVHDYTLRSLQAFDHEQCLPDMVAVGNEVTNGIMWPDAGPMHGDTKWPALIDLLRAGISAVRETAPANKIKVMIHIDQGGDKNVSDYFFTHCQKANLDFDVIGLSYYPFWHGTLDQLSDNLAATSKKFSKDIYVVETAYYTRGKPRPGPYPQTAEGQKKFLDALFPIVANTPDHHGKGVFYWEPTWIDGPKWNGPRWSPDTEARALFDTDGNALPAIASFRFTAPNKK